MKTIYFYILLMFSLTILFPACECEDLAPTIPSIPDPFQIVNTDVDPGLTSFFIAVDFNKVPNFQSIEFGGSLLQEGLRDDEQSFLSVSTSDTPTRIFINGEPDCFFNDDSIICPDTIFITFKGTGSNVITSTEGQILDGDENGSDGGDYILKIPYDN